MALIGKDYINPQEIIRRGFKARLLKDNDVFIEVVNEMYDKYTLKEDIVMASELDYKTRAEQITRFASLRHLLSELVLTLDGFAMEADNEQFKESSQQ